MPRCRRCCPTRASTTWTPRPAVRAARRARGCPRGSASCGARTERGSMISSSDRTAEICLASALDDHLAVRHQVFVVQQKLFDQTDVDSWDSCGDTLHAVALVDGSVVGTVRLYPLRDGVWKGDRLAVLPSARVHRLGAALVNFAVRTAG